MSTETRTVTIGGKAMHVERVSARKASRAMALLRHINREAKGITRSLEEFERDYLERNLRYITRPEARVRFPPQVVLDPETGAPVREPATIVVDVGGDSEEQPNPRAGELVTFPSAVDRMSEADWQAAGNQYPVRERPPLYAIAMHAFEDALELAEDHVYRLLALFVMSNEDVTRRYKEGTLEEELTAGADRLLDEAMADELMELAVVCGELVDTQFRSKARELGDRLGNALRLFGLGPSTPTTTTSTPPNGPTSSTPSSSIASPSSSEPDGPPTSSSTPITTSSSESEPSPTEPDPAMTTQGPAPRPSEPSATHSAPPMITSETMEPAR
jgi:hypothetical protein